MDTYDRRWSRLGQVWARREGASVLVEPPSFLPLGDDMDSAFGLQKPQFLGKASVKVRSLEFVSPDSKPILGQVVKIRTRSYLVLFGTNHSRWNSLLGALVADGLESLPDDTPGEPLVKDRGPGFQGPTAWPIPGHDDPGTPFLLDRLRDGLRVAREYERGIRDDVGSECLHRYRVHLRRVRSLASLGRMWELLPEWNRLKMVLRSLQQRTNELRDLDVLRIDFPQLQGLLPWDEGQRLSGWRASLEVRRAAEFRGVKSWIVSEEHRFASLELDGLLRDLADLGEPWTVADLAASAFQKSARSLKQSLEKLGSDPADQALHEVRIQAKRMRSILLERLKGELEALRTKRQEAGASFDPLTFGLLLEVLVSDRARSKSEALADSAKLGSKPFLKALGRLVESRDHFDGP